MKNRSQIFISFTSEDLKEERAKVNSGIMGIGLYSL